MKNYVITALIATVICLVVGTIGYALYKNGEFGVEIPSAVALFETSLSSKIASGSTTMTLVSGEDKDGNTLSGKYGFIIDEGGSDEEFVMADCVDTACTNMLRGLSVVSGDTEVSSLKKPHRRGASVKMTNWPIIGILQRLASGSVGYDDYLYYTETIGTTGFSGTASTSAFATKYYVDEVGAGGFTTLNVGTDDGLIALGTTPETVGVNISSTSGFYFETAGDLAIYASTGWNSLIIDDDGQVAVGSGSFELGAITGTSITLTTALDETYGGTGTVSWDAGDICYASADNTLGSIASGSEDYVLRMVGGFPAWSSGYTVVSRSFTAENMPDDASHNTIYTATVGANSMGANGSLRLTVGGNLPTAGYNGGMLIKFGGTTISSIAFGGTGGDLITTANIGNRNAAGSQVSMVQWMVDTEVSTSAGTSSIDTTSAQDITVIINKEATGGGGTLDYFLLERF